MTTPAHSVNMIAGDAENNRHVSVSAFIFDGQSMHVDVSVCS